MEIPARMNGPNQWFRCHRRGGQLNLFLAALICLLAVTTWACQTHEQKARAKLEAMGVEYSEAGFLQKVEEGDNTAVRLFLTAGMQQNKPAMLQALMRAIARRNAETMSELIASGADVNANAEGWGGGTALTLAVGRGDTGIARELIAHS